MLNGLDLFSGIGGMSIALSKWVKPIAYCEINPYCQGMLLSRMADESLPNCPIWDDIETLDGNIFTGAIDIIYGGFPCQDISIAGNGKGLDGERSGLFFEIMRLAKEIKPTFIFLENVPATTTRGGVRIVREITKMGYDCRWCVISAASIGALHKRERWFLLAYSMRQGLQIGKEERQNKIEKISTLRSNSDKESIGLWQASLSDIPRTADGIPRQLDRIKALGNAVVPKQAKEAFKILMEINND